MIFAGSHVQLESLADGIIELRFDAADAKVNILSEAALGELRTAVDALKQQTDAHGLIISSAKDSFILGADITEFSDQDDRLETIAAVQIHTQHAYDQESLQPSQLSHGSRYQYRRHLADRQAPSASQSVP